MNWIKNYVGNLHIVHNGRYRGDCPLCGRVNTFSVTDTGFERLWYCFHADCHTKGSTGVQLTKENSKVAFKEKITSTETNDEFEIPNTFVSLSRSKQAEEYVKNNPIEAKKFANFKSKSKTLDYLTITPSSITLSNILFKKDKNNKIIDWKYVDMENIDICFPRYIFNLNDTKLYPINKVNPDIIIPRDTII